MNRKVITIFVVFLFVSLFNSGCVEENRTGDTSEPGEIIYPDISLEDLEISTENFPNISSSTSAHPLAVLLACKILNISYVWTNDIVYPYSFKNMSISNYSYLNTYQYSYFGYVNPENYIVPNSSEIGKENIVENITYKVNRGGTHGSYVGLIDGEYDLIIAARLPSDDELELATNKSVSLISKSMALDAFVFILNELNPINNLTVNQIKNIYTGNIMNWSDVGGNDSWEITPYQRNQNSGSQELMETLVMKDLEMIPGQPMIMAYSMSGPYNKLSYNEKGIAYTVYYYKEFMANNYRNIKLCGINGIYPGYNTIHDQTYPYTTKVYVVTRNDLDPESPAYKIRDLILNENGQEIVKESGYVPISN